MKITFYSKKNINCSNAYSQAATCSLSTSAMFSGCIPLTPCCNYQTHFLSTVQVTIETAPNLRASLSPLAFSPSILASF
jgi:hypothetical protein